MTYLDASVALAHLRAEDRRPGAEFWQQPIISSRLLEYEIRTVMNLRPALRAEDEAVRTLIGRIALLELIPEVVERARDRFPLRVRTLDALHLASAMFLMNEGVPLEIATYDQRMRDAARKLKIPLCKAV
jgi:predicted nucleic acid-binding protein